MTLRNITFHQNVLKSDTIKGQKIIDTKITDIDRWKFVIEKSAQYIPFEAHEKLKQIQEESYEKPLHYDPNKLNRIPQGYGDSRSLLEARFPLEIERQEQTNIKSGLVEVYDDALNVASGKIRIESNDRGRVRYLFGISESINIAKNDIFKDETGINEDVCLYELVKKYENLSSQIYKLISDSAFNNSRESDFSESYHLGLASGYKNASGIISDRLTTAENDRYRATQA